MTHAPGHADSQATQVFESFRYFIALEKLPDATPTDICSA